MNDPTGMADDIRCGDTMEGAALGLLALMTGISEGYWCAGWMSGLEYDLWQAAPGKSCGQGEITTRQAELLRLLSEECDGWWAWTDDTSGPEFVRTEEWLKRVSAAPAPPEPPAPP